ncbi:hypothetical protein ACFLYH_01885 [Candidatus Dependentiae bacterium]
MKKTFQILLLFVFCFTLNTTSNAYTKKDLEDMKTYSAVAEAILSVPCLLQRDVESCQDILPVPSMLIERSISGALEQDIHVISEFTNLLLALKVSAKNFKIQLFYTILFRITNRLICLYSGSDKRVIRRMLRCVIYPVLRTWILSVSRIMPKNQILNDFVISSILNAITECCGEIIIQGVKEN